MASSCARQAERPPGRASYLFGARAGVQRGLLLTIRGGGNRQLTWHTMPTKRMGPAARSFAADAHDCIMVRIQTDLPNTSVRREIRAQWRAPLGSSADRQPSDAGASQKAPVAVHHRSACSGVKALRNTSDARRQAAKLR